MQRITESNLKAVIARLNRATGSPEQPYAAGEPQANCWHIGYAYGGYQLQRMSSRPGCTGVSTYGGYGTKRDLWDRVQAMLDGIAAATPQTV